MKTLITLAAVAALAGTGYAQMTTLPPASSTDGVLIQHIGVNAGATHWEAPLGINSFRIDSTTDGTAKITTVAYNPIGLPFSTALPGGLQDTLNTVNLKGGIMRTIFLADSATWNDSLGYTYTGAFAGPQSYTAFAKMDVNPVTATSVKFGDYFDVSLLPGTASKFDLWYQGENSTNGGDYTLFHPANSSNAVAPGNALWGQKSLLTNTWNATLGAYVDITTYVVGLEDWRLDRGSDHDYSDSVFALQFYTLTGAPDLQVVPEPATYGLFGVAALLGLVALRRRTRKSPPSINA
jgi:hypothetical protein